MRKSPRDFVHVDEFWEADDDWPGYFVDKKVWVYYDEYNAELAGDEDYCRIIIHSDSTDGVIYKRPLSDRRALDEIMRKMEQPLSKKHLMGLGFQGWKGSYP